VLAGDLGSEGLNEKLIIGPNAPRMGGGRGNATPAVPRLDIPTFHAGGAEPSSWIKPGDKPLTFRTSGQQKDVTLAPINSIFGKRYSVYWQVT